MKLWIPLIAMLMPATAHAGEGVQPPARTTPAASLDGRYLNGRWCELSGDGWVSFDAATSRINLPNGNTGRRVVGTYRLAGSQLSITGPTGARVDATLTRVDARSMSFDYGGQTALVRRC